MFSDAKLIYDSLLNCDWGVVVCFFELFQPQATFTGGFLCGTVALFIVVVVFLAVAIV